MSIFEWAWAFFYYSSAEIKIRMDAKLHRIDPIATLPRPASNALALAALVLLWLIGLLLSWRFVSGAFGESPSVALLLLTSLLVILLDAAARSANLADSARRDWAPWISLPAVALIAGALTAATDTWLGYAALWLPLLVGELARSGGLRRLSVVGATPRRGHTPVRQADRRVACPQNVTEETTGPLPPDVVQRFRRTQSADGVETWSGQMRAVLSAGQRGTQLHIAFCPPFEQLPELFFEQIEGPPARIKPGQQMPYAARLDVRLSRVPTESVAVVVEIIAVASPNDAAV